MADPLVVGAFFAFYWVPRVSGPFFLPPFFSQLPTEVQRGYRGRETGHPASFFGVRKREQGEEAVQVARDAHKPVLPVMPLPGLYEGSEWLFR